MTVFRLLDGRLRLNGAPRVGFVVCGGASLLATGLLHRTTRDVDILAFIDDAGVLTAPVPFPLYLVQAAQEVEEALGLPKEWLNNGPSRDPGGLQQMGLPEGLPRRLVRREIGSHLTVYFVSRFDQIHFKLYAAVDHGGGHHEDDLWALRPEDAEIEAAARWAMTHDVSTGFRALLLEFLRKTGHAAVAERL